MLTLKPALAVPLPCKICDAPASLYGVVDFNKSCSQPRGSALAGVPVYYRRCDGCGFVFTDAFDDWSPADFNAHIYNDGYLAADPDYKETRPRANAAMVEQMFGPSKAQLRVLDYGGGNDTLCSDLRAAGFAAAVTYDPFVPKHAERPTGKFDLVTCFETLEHMPNPVSGIGSILESLADPGLVLFSTQLQPAPKDMALLNVNWWYIAPRNGHVSIFSPAALTIAWRRHGFTVVSCNDNLHAAFRNLPDFAKYLISPTPK